jgi:hypothetical protein
LSVRFAAVALSVILLFVVGSVPVFAYSSNTNVYIGISPNECSAQDTPTVSLLFNQTMVTTVSNGNQWSAQTNAYPLANPAGLDFLQFNLAINSAGQIYGAVEYWIPSGSVYNVHTSTLATVTHVSKGDEFITTILEDNGNNNNQLYSVSFTYYQASTGNSWTLNINPPTKNYVQVASWQLNIVGESTTSNPRATFNSGGGTTTYFSLVSASTWLSSQPKCVQGQGVLTGETSNMQYATPTTSCITTCVLQGFKY